MTHVLTGIQYDSCTDGDGGMRRGVSGLLFTTLLLLHFCYYYYSLQSWQHHPPLNPGPLSIPLYVNTLHRFKLRFTTKVIIIIIIADGVCAAVPCLPAVASCVEQRSCGCPQWGHSMQS